MINFIKSIFVGIFNIVPGLSGSALLIALNLYEESLESISNFFINPKKSTIFLTPIALGIIIGTYLFSNIIFLLLKNYEMETSIIFSFLVLGTIPHLIKDSIKDGFKTKYLIPFIFTFVLGTSLVFINKQNISYQIDYNLISISKYLLIGIILSFSTIIPGISSTIILSLNNLYGIYIYSIKSINLFVLIPTLIGFIITTFFISKIITKLLKKYYGYTYFAILGFILSTIPCLLKTKIVLNINFTISILIGIISFFITNYIFKHI